MEKNQIEIYRSADGGIELNVKLENDTVWLTQNQMAELFGKDQSVIARHIANVFKEEEVAEESNMQILHNTLYKFRPTKIYSLDVIISVGYRVNSKNATAFRKWATNVLKQYLIKGYVINQKRLDHYNDLKSVVNLMSRAIALQQKVSKGEYEGLFSVISDYVYALDTLDRYESPSCVPRVTLQRERRTLSVIETPWIIHGSSSMVTRIRYGYPSSILKRMSCDIIKKGLNGHSTHGKQAAIKITLLRFLIARHS